MPLVGTTEMFKKAYDGHYAIGAFNVNNMEIIQGIMAAAKEKQSLLFSKHQKVLEIMQVKSISSGLSKLLFRTTLKFPPRSTLITVPLLRFAKPVLMADLLLLCTTALNTLLKKMYVLQKKS